MEDFLATVRSISSDKNYVQLADYLNRSNELLAKYAGQIDAAIASLDPDQHSLAFMALLWVQNLFTRAFQRATAPKLFVYK